MSDALSVREERPELEGKFSPKLMSLFFLPGRLTKFLHGNNSTAEASSNLPFVYSSVLFFSFLSFFYMVSLI